MEVVFVESNIIPQGAVHVVLEAVTTAMIGPLYTVTLEGDTTGSPVVMPVTATGATSKLIVAPKSAATSV